MKIIEYSHLVKTEHKRPCAVALGYFDGVHTGHRALISMLTEKAKELSLTSCLFTFSESLAKSKNKQTTIYKLEDKIKFFETLGIDEVVIADFDDVSDLTPEEFVGDVLINSLGVDIALCGYNFRFGRSASGDAPLLSRLMAKNGAQAIILSEMRLDGEEVSATRIKKLLKDGNIEKANRLLGTPYFIRGAVEKGLGLGGAYGFPTVNTSLDESIPLATGVYRTAMKIGEKLYTGITNVGSCPTVKEREIHAETLIANFTGDLYGKNICIYFLGYLRNEKSFASIDELREQIYKDRDTAIKLNGDLTKWHAIGQSLL